MKASRTFALASMGIVALVVIAAALLVALFLAMAKPELSHMLPSVLSTLSVIVGALAATAAGGAGAVGIRHFGSSEQSSWKSNPIEAKAPKP